MVVFPNSKINLGLHVVARRGDGFHDISTVFYPVSWCDALEIIVSENNEPFQMSQSGLAVNGAPTSNIIYKAWQSLSTTKKLPNLVVHLHKNVPMGAGLGGGSSDAASFIITANKLLQLNLSTVEQMNLASTLGSDCAFFIKNSPVIASGKGDQFKELNVDLSSYYIFVVHPGIHSNTADAYAGIKPAIPENNIEEVLKLPVSDWKERLYNDFEIPIFKKYPEIKALKQLLYDSGALYASMSGSGSAVYGLFAHPPQITLPEGYRSHLQKPAPGIDPVDR